MLGRFTAFPSGAGCPLARGRRLRAGRLLHTAGQGQVHRLQELPLLRPLREAGRQLQRLQVRPFLAPPAALLAAALTARTVPDLPCRSDELRCTSERTREKHMAPSNQPPANYALNAVQCKLEGTGPLRAGRQPFLDDTQLNALRNKHRATHFFRREGDTILSVAVTADNTETIGAPEDVALATAPRLLAALAMDSLLRHFSATPRANNP